jgi:hypothetical protein
MEAPSMTEDDVRAAAERLVQFHERFAPLFGKEQGYRPDCCKNML